MRRSRCEPGLWMPGVSTKTICAAGCESRRAPFFAGTSTTPAMRLRGVCGLAETMATFPPVRAFSSVLLPALGRPRMATNPDLKGDDTPGCLLSRIRGDSAGIIAHEPRKQNRTPHSSPAGTSRCAADARALSAMGDRSLPVESRALALPARWRAPVLPGYCTSPGRARRSLALDHPPGRRAIPDDRVH